MEDLKGRALFVPPPPGHMRMTDQPQGKCLVPVVEVDGFAFGEDAFHAGLENFPLLLAPEVVGHEETAAVQKIAELGRLPIRQIPLPGLHRV